MATMTDLRSMGPQPIFKPPVHQLPPANQPLPVNQVLLLPPPEADYLVLSIISFLFFIPLSILALWFSLQTRRANFRGDQREAQRSSMLALGFGVSSILVGCLILIGSIVARVLIGKTGKV